MVAALTATQPQEPMRQETALAAGMGLVLDESAQLSASVGLGRLGLASFHAVAAERLRAVQRPVGAGRQRRLVVRRRARQASAERHRQARGYRRPVVAGNALANALADFPRPGLVGIAQHGQELLAADALKRSPWTGRYWPSRACCRTDAADR